MFSYITSYFSKVTEQPINLMTKSLTTSLQHAVNTMRDITLDQTVPYITSVLEQPISIFTTNDVETGVVASAEECFELPPIKHLPNDISNNVLESIINEFRDVSADDEIRRAKSEELQRKLKLYNSIMEKKCDEELIHSRRSRRKDGGSGASTPRLATPVRKLDNVSYTSPCLMNVSIYDNAPPNDELLEQEIEEKEKILAKMLNLESLSITGHKPQEDDAVPNDITVVPTYKQIDVQPVNETEKPVTPKHLKAEEKKEKPVKIHRPVENVKIAKTISPFNLVPKVVQLPNNWNLENIELKLEKQNGLSKNNVQNIISPDDNFESEWEII